jgi:hypothetical protein
VCKISKAGAIEQVCASLDSDDLCYVHCRVSSYCPGYWRTGGKPVENKGSLYSFRLKKLLTKWLIKRHLSADVKVLHSTQDIKGPGPRPSERLRAGWFHCVYQVTIQVGQL